VSQTGGRFAFRACGDDVTIHEWVRILGADQTSVGSHVLVDDFVFIDGRAGIAVGSWVHISMFASIFGGGEAAIGDFVNIAAGARLITGTDLFDGSGLAGATIPDEFRSVERGRIVLGDHVMVSANAVVLPNVTIGEGAVIGAGSVVTQDVPPWTIAIGQPARPHRERPRERILAFAEALRTGNPRPGSS
jgi:acetyltransferase-like isoleucine patch superfamily enzyme